MNRRTSALKDRLREALALRGKKAVDLTRDLQIPKSAVSQYLSGKSQNMDSERLYAISVYLDVTEPWLLGYDVPMEKSTEKRSDDIAAIAERLLIDDKFLSSVLSLYKLESEKLDKVDQLLQLL